MSVPSSLAKVDDPSSGSGVLFDALIAPYLAKIGAERRARVAGRIVDADFLLRQVTVFEIALDLAARSEGRVGIDALEEACRFKDYALDEIAESPLSALLGHARSAKGQPARPVPTRNCCSAMANSRPSHVKFFPDRNSVRRRNWRRGQRATPPPRWRRWRGRCS